MTKGKKEGDKRVKGNRQKKDKNKEEEVKAGEEITAIKNKRPDA